MFLDERGISSLWRPCKTQSLSNNVTPIPGLPLENKWGASVTTQNLDTPTETVSEKPSQKPRVLLGITPHVQFPSINTEIKRSRVLEKKKRQEKAVPKTPKGPSSRKNIEAKMQANKEKGHQTDLGTAGKLNPKRKRRNKYSSYWVSSTMQTGGFQSNVSPLSWLAVHSPLHAGNNLLSS